MKYGILKPLFLAGAVLPLLPYPAGAETVRPAVGKYLLQAEGDLRVQKYDAALHAVDAAQAVGNLSPYESLAVAQLRGSAAAGAGQYVLAAQSYQAVLASGAAPASTRLVLIQAIAGFYDHAGNYQQTLVWVHKYVAAGGQDQQTRALAAQADYTQGDYAAAVADVQRDAKAEARPLEAELQLGVSAAQKTGDNQAYFSSLQQLLSFYPSAPYWNEAIALVQNAPSFPDGLTLDVYRLRLATNTLTQPADYEDYAERAILAGQPAEAKRVLDTGFANGTLNAQTDGGHAARLQALADKDAAAPQNASAPASTALDGAIQAGPARLENVPGFAAATPDQSQAALARLWYIQLSEKNGAA